MAPETRLDQRLTLAPCTVEEYPELLTSLDRWFGKDREQWFAHNLTHIFRPEAASVRCHNVVKLDGAMVGIIGIYPFRLRIGRAVLNVGGVGSVSTAPALRGRGVMSFMLREVGRMLVEGGYDVSWLHGDRYRYANYGWEPAGRAARFAVRPRDIRRRHPRLARVQLKRVTAAAIPTLARLQSRFSSYVRRNPEQWRIHIARENLSWSLARSPRGKAYLCHAKENPHNVLELQGESRTVLALLAAHGRTHKLDRLTVTFPAAADALSRALFAVADEFILCSQGQIRVIDTDGTWEKLLPELASRNPAIGADALTKMSRPDERSAILERALGFFDHLPPLPTSLAHLEALQPLGWWLSRVDGV